MNIRPAYATPLPPIPEPTLGSEMGSFAHHTVTVRMPDIARRLLTDNDFSPEVAKQVETLIKELPDGPVRLIQDDGAPDTSDWQRYIAPHLGKTWLEVPWFFAEHYFYRRILEATGYFQPGPGQSVDPFASEKERGLQAGMASIQSLAAQADNWREPSVNAQTAFSRLLQATLWGNQGDLSMWPVGKNERPDHAGAGQQDAHLVIDETPVIIEALFNHPSQPAQIDMILDNAGFELVSDLIFSDYVLNSQVVKAVNLHLKAHPTFVSDATVEDIQRTLSCLAGDPHPSVQRLAGRLYSHIESQRLRLLDSYFWNSPLDFWEMPLEVRTGLAHSDLVVSKGDANYRRLLGDRHWPLSAPLPNILRYFPAPLALVRVLKSETLAGLQPGQGELLYRRDPNWLTDGKWGLVQFWSGR